MARQLGSVTLEVAVEKAKAQQDLRELEQGMKNLEQAALKTGQATDKQAASYENLGKRTQDLRDKIKRLEIDNKGAAESHEAQVKSAGAMSAALIRYASAAVIGAAIKSTINYADK